jgi:hypothetical protein
VTFTVSGFYESYTCSISGTGLSRDLSNTYSFDNPWGTSRTHETQWYSKNAPTVTCTGTGFFKRVASGTASAW